MPRFLFASAPADGHVGPLLPLARELLERGHDVAWMTGVRYRERVEATGARWYPLSPEQDHDLIGATLDERYPGRAATKGLARFKFDMRNIFIARVPGQLADLERTVADVAPDVLVVEPAYAGAATALHDRLGLPWATVGITALTMPSVDAAPFGLGLAPMRGPLGRLRNGVLHRLIDVTLFRAIDRDYRAMCAQIGVTPVAGGLFATTLSPYLYLHPSVPGFEYPRSDLPAQVRFIGPSLPAAPAAGTELPDWWEAMPADERPVVLVTQGTVATDPGELLLPTLAALADEPVQVIAVTGGPDPADLPAPPANARIERYVPFGALMPHVDAFVTNGGYGGLHFALAHGVPIVVAGATEEKPELVARVRWSGVGVGMRTQQARPAKVRAAVRRVLGDPAIRARAAALQAQMRATDGPAGGAALLEELYATVAGDGAGARVAAGVSA
jgi:UDP:flavonoid glycosyltransferase YjiC (YdhE family)